MPETKARHLADFIFVLAEDHGDAARTGGLENLATVERRRGEAVPRGGDEMWAAR
jgi:hypothetical protein